jgi:glycosyltransferase involved in cell wall biosynthesis
MRFKLQNKQILVKFLSRTMTVEALKQSDLFLFTSNIECSPLVLFEANAAKLPFLTTDVGNAKEIIEWTQGGLLLPTILGVEFNRTFRYKFKKIVKKILASLKLFRGKIKYVNFSFSTPDIAQSVKVLERIYQDKNLRGQLAANGFKSWQEKFTWEKIAKKYEELYLSLMQ